MAIQDDFTLNYTAKTISHTSGSTRYTVNALYSWLMDLFDDSGQMDDTVPISAQTPVEYTLINGWTFNADSDLGYLYGGSIVVEKATIDRDIWANFYTLGTIETDAVVYWQQNGSLVAAHPGYTSGHIDQLIKVMSGGTLTDSGYVTAFARNRASGNADLYDNFTGQATATGGRNPIPLATSPDANDDGSDVSAYTITLGFAGYTEDVDGDGTAESYDIKVDGQGTYTALQCYRWLKYMTRRENTTDLGGGVAGRFYRYANASYAEVKSAPFGTFAGGKFFGARGVLLTNITDSNNRQLIDSAGNSRIPPTTVSITVTGTVAGDRVMVARSSGGVINKSQFTLAGAHSAATTVTVNEALGNDIPSSGYLRLGDTGFTYSGIDRGAKQFTGVSPAMTGANLDPLYSPYIDGVSGTDPMSKSFVYVSDFDVIARSRKKGILPFENTATVGSAGATVAVIRTTDTIVT
ncbi:MAG: hypothetical protein ACRCV5_10525 [Afipia sp.]